MRPCAGSGGNNFHHEGKNITPRARADAGKLDADRLSRASALARELRLSSPISSPTTEERLVQDNHPAASAARELKAAARDALRMGSQWAHTALQWVEDRSHDMNNRTRGPGQYERSQSDLHSASAYGTGEYASGAGHGAEPDRNTAHLSGGHQGEHADADRDIQSRYASGGYAQHNQGREGSYPQATSLPPGEDGDRGHDFGFGSPSRPARSNPASWVGRGNERDMARASRGDDRGDAGHRGFDTRDVPRFYGQGTAGDTHATTDGTSGLGGYSQEGYGDASSWRDPRSRESWRAQDVTGQGLGERGYGVRGATGAGRGGYRGLGPKNYTRSDERIRDDLNERLTDSDEIDASGISVDVSNGVATLTGTVEQRWMKHRAEDLAEACSGVRDVNNQIRVTNASSRPQESRGAMGTSATQGSGRAGASTSPGGGASGLGHSGGGGSTSPSAGSASTGTSNLSTGAGSTPGSSARSSGSPGSTVA
jgi:osmotically-inducible protein OsmY